MRHRLYPLVSVSIMFVILLLLLLAEGCSSAPEPQSTPATPSTQTAPPKLATPTPPTKPTGSLVIAGYFGSGSLDPADASPNTFQGMSAAVFDSIVEMSPEGQIRPGIAERWEIAPDGKTHTFTIRKGVKFHDGSDLTGADVKFSIDRVLSQGTYPDVEVWRAAIASVELKDDFTLVLRMKSPQFELLKSFSDFGGMASVVPMKYIKDKGDEYFRNNLMGSGPWKLMKYVPGISAELEAVESHWRKVPEFKTLSLRYIPEEATKVAMLKTGELDLADIGPDSVAGLKAAGVRMLKHDGASQYYATMWWDMENPGKYLLGDPRVRKALSFAANRKELADQILTGNAEPSALFYARPTAFFWDPNQLKADPYDPEGAKKLLTEAGFPNGFSIKVWDRDPGGLPTTLNTAMVGYWRKVGVNAELSGIAYTALRPKFATKVLPEMYDTIFAAVAAGGIFQFEKMSQMYHSTASIFHNIKNPRLDELIEKVPNTLDPAEKKKLAIEAAVLAKNEYTIIPFLDIMSVYAISSKIAGITPTKGISSLANAYETITRAK